MAENDVARQQSLIDLEELYVWLQQFEDPSIGGGKHVYTKKKKKKRKLHSSLDFRGKISSWLRS